jgi:cytochrome c
LLRPALPRYGQARHPPSRAIPPPRLEDHNALQPGYQHCRREIPCPGLKLLLPHPIKYLYTNIHGKRWKSGPAARSISHSRRSELKRVIVILGVFCLVAGFAHAGVSMDEAKKMVDGAVTYVNTNGKEKALSEFDNPKGKFVKGDLYVFAYDMSAVMLAHPVNPKLVGKNLMEVPDVEGKLFRKEIVEVAKTKGVGWVDYKYKNPESNKTESKTTYLRKVGDIILCCGAYK